MRELARGVTRSRVKARGWALARFRGGLALSRDGRLNSSAGVSRDVYTRSN